MAERHAPDLTPQQRTVLLDILANGGSVDQHAVRNEYGRVMEQLYRTSYLCVSADRRRVELTRKGRTAAKSLAAQTVTVRLGNIVIQI